MALESKKRAIVRRDEHDVPHLNWYRDRRAGWVFGVCAGLAKATGIPVEIFRIGFVVAATFGGGILLYLVFAILMPSGPNTRPSADGKPPIDIPE